MSLYFVSLTEYRRKIKESPQMQKKQFIKSFILSCMIKKSPSQTRNERKPLWSKPGCLGNKTQDQD